MIEAIYLVGFICAYLLGKMTFKRQFNKWTIGNRNFHLLMSLFSWVSVIALTCIIFIDSMHTKKSKKNDKQANW